MRATNLRKVGGSVMMAVPTAMLDQLDLQAGSTVALSIEQGKLVVTPSAKPRYTLEQLLAQCDAAAPAVEADQDWLSDRPVGNELL